MTEIKFEKSVFVKTLEALTQNFTLASPLGVLTTEKKNSRFSLELMREGMLPVAAFGPCEMKGPDVKVNFNINQLLGQINATSVDNKFVTIHAGGGMLMVA